MADRPRVIIALPDSSESAVIAAWLVAEGFDPVVRPAPQSAADEMLRPFALLIADAAFRGLHEHCRERNPLVPTILVGNGATAAGGVHTMHVKRPIDHTVLACFVSMAILDSRPARRSIRKPVSQIAAVVNGVPSQIIDVSAEGLRLEMTRERRSALPPYFTVRVPIVGVALTVQRMWTKTAPSVQSPIWYGAALSRNRASVDLAWRAFVENLTVATNIVDH